MKKASSSFLVFAFAVLLVSFQSFAYNGSRDEVLSERIQQTLSNGARMKLADYLRLSPQEQRQIEVLRLSIMAQSFRGPAILNVLSAGRIVGSLQVRRNLDDATIELTPPVQIDLLELSSSEEIFIESISLEVRRLATHQPLPPGHRPFPGPGPGPGPGQGPGMPRERQPLPQEFIRVQINQEVRGQMVFPLKMLVAQQAGINITNAELERVVIEAHPMAMGRGGATVQIELNGRLVGMPRPLAPGNRVTPLVLNSFEDVQTLRLIVRGEAQIQNVHIRVGNVRHEIPRAQRVQVRTEISNGRALDLARLLPYENRLVRSIGVEATMRMGQADIALFSVRGEFLGSTRVSQIPMRSVIQLARPVALQELRLTSFAPVMIEALELEFDMYRSY